MKKQAVLSSLLVLSLALPYFAYAQNPAPAPAGVETPTEKAPAADSQVFTDEKTKSAVEAFQESVPSDEYSNYLYEKPTIEKFSQLYWGLGKLDVKNNQNVDYFLMINECDIYKDYSHNEFEWKTIREAARVFLKTNAATFPLRFELIEPMRLGRYDLEKNQFNVVEEFKIDGIRRFEILADNFTDTVCGFDPTGRGKNIEGYPRAIVVELNRPIVLGVIPVEPKLAKEYIDEKMEKFEGLNADKQTEENLYAFRDAYLIMKVKFFAYKNEEKNREGQMQAHVMAILESIEVYADSKKKKLLYMEDYKRKRKERRGFKKSDGSPSHELSLPNPNPNLNGDTTEPDPSTEKPGVIEIPAYSPGHSEE